jgi:hypothetical protein
MTKNYEEMSSGLSHLKTFDYDFCTNTRKTVNQNTVSWDVFKYFQNIRPKIYLDATAITE